MTCCSGPRRWPQWGTARSPGDSCRDDPRGASRLPRRPGSHVTGRESSPETARKSRHGYGVVLADVRYLFYLAALFLMTIVYTQYIAVLPVAIVDSGLSLWWYSAVVSLNAIIVAVCEVPATKYVQTWPLRLTAFAG